MSEAIASYIVAECKDLESACSIQIHIDSCGWRLAIPENYSTATTVFFTKHSKQLMKVKIDGDLGYIEIFGPAGEQDSEQFMDTEFRKAAKRIRGIVSKN